MLSFISQEKILKILLDFNPWWNTGQMPRNFEKPIKRLAFYEAKKHFFHREIKREVILSGPRRVGKTTIMYQMISEILKHSSSKQILYVSFDNPILQSCEIADIFKIFQNNISRESEELFLFFDEIQYSTNWDICLKTLFDQHPFCKIMATNSASPILAEKTNEGEVDRWIQIKIPTLSFYEYIDLIKVHKPDLPKNIKPTQLESLDEKTLSSIMISLQPLQKHFHQYLLIGGFPEVAQTRDISLAQNSIQEDIVDKVIKKDLVTLFNIRNISELREFFLYLCETSGNIVVTETIAKEVGVSRPTINNYLQLLEQANLIYVIKPFELNENKIVKSKPKVYFADPAIRNAVLMLGEEILTNPLEMETTIKTVVYKHIHTFFYNQHPLIGYSRNAKTQKEIDIIVSLPIGRILIEVKYRQNSTISKNEAIVEWANDPQTIGAIIITRDNDDYGITNHNTRTKIIRLPAFAFLYLLGHAEKEGYDN